MHVYLNAMRLLPETDLASERQERASLYQKVSGIPEAAYNTNTQFCHY